MSLTYASFISQFYNLVAAISTANGSTGTDPNWSIELPGVIDYAEQRCYRDLDLLATRYTDATTAASSGVGTFSLSSATTNFLVLEGVNYFVSSAGVGSSSITSTNGTRTQLIPTTRQFIDAVYGSTCLGPPQYYAMVNSSTILLGPIPDQKYLIEIVGTGRPTPLSSANSTTYLSNSLPDLFMAAAMVKASGFMRDFGSQSDNPQMGAAWEAQYKLLLNSALTEEFRKKGQGAAWTSQLTAPSATPPRS
jgi:hypothetical protein